jgi:hypothetical protein
MSLVAIDADDPDAGISNQYLQTDTFVLENRVRTPRRIKETSHKQSVFSQVLTACRICTRAHLV